MTLDDRVMDTILNASMKFISDHFNKVDKELSQRAARIMKHKNCTIAIHFSREDHAKYYPDIPFDNPPNISED